MLQGLQDLGAAYWSFMNPLTLLYGLGGAFVGILMGILPGLSATLARLMRIGNRSLTEIWDERQGLS